MGTGWVRKTDKLHAPLFIYYDIDFHMYGVAKMASMAAAGPQKLAGFFGGFSLHAPFLSAGHVHSCMK
jgi:hypothetical protein